MPDAEGNPTPDEVRQDMGRRMAMEISKLPGMEKVAPPASPTEPTESKATLGGPTPPPPPPTEPAVGSPPPQTADDWAAAVDPRNGKYWGKYNTKEEAIKGYWNAQNALTSALDRNTQLEETVRQLSRGTTPDGYGAPPPFVPGGVPGASPRVNPVGERTPAMQELLARYSEESGLAPDLVEQTFNVIASNIMESKLQPILRLNEAEAYMRQHYPDAINHQQEMGNFLRSNPDVAVDVRDMMEAGKEKAAMVHAWREYEASLKGKLDRNMRANAEIAEEERAAARAAAGVPSTPTSGAHAETGEPQAFTKEEVEALNESAAYDNGVARRRAWLAPILPPGFFDGTYAP